MQRLSEALASGRVLVSDGAWGTFLQRQGLRPGECPELWCVDRRTDVLAIAHSYVAAGADMIETNSFGGTRFKLAHYGVAERAAEINRAAAAISREAAGPDRYVLGSAGPTGRLLLMGDTTEQELYDAFAEQLAALQAGGADACCLETFSALDEAELAVKAARGHTDLDVIVTFTFERTVNGEYRTMMGVSPTAMAQAMAAAGAHVIGTNCGNGMARMVDIVRELRQAAPVLPILVHANAGAPTHIDGADVFPETPAMMAERVDDLIAAGAGVIGGCCGTTPDHIRAIRKAVDRHNRGSGSRAAGAAV